MFIRFSLGSFYVYIILGIIMNYVFKELCPELLKSSMSDVALKYFYVHCFGEQPYVFFSFFCVSVHFYNFL